MLKISGEFSGNSRMNQKIAEDRVITWEEKNTRERMLNSHALQMGRFLMVGQAHPNQKEKVEWRRGQGA